MLWSRNFAFFGNDLQTSEEPVLVSNFYATLCNVNMRSMCNKFPGFKDFVLENEFTIVAVTETWLQYDEPDDHYSLPGFKLVRHDRGNKRGGGVALYVADYLKFSRLEFPPETSSIEVLLIRVNTGKLTTGVGVVYRPNDTNYLDLNIISDIVNCFFL